MLFFFSTPIFCFGVALILLSCSKLNFRDKLELYDCRNTHKKHKKVFLICISFVPIKLPDTLQASSVMVKQTEDQSLSLQRMKLMTPCEIQNFVRDDGQLNV